MKKLYIIFGTLIIVGAVCVLFTLYKKTTFPAIHNEIVETTTTPSVVWKKVSVEHVDGFIRSDSSTYPGLGPNIKYFPPESVSKGTNLSADSYISIEQKISETGCTADIFLDTDMLKSKPVLVTEHGVTYSIGSTTGAAAGNRYEEIIYALQGTNPCVAVRYFIHSGVFENYPEGTVKRFDKNALISQFDIIRKSLILK
jgi:hypothetical protein